MAGWLGSDQEALHVAFGSVLGADKKMLKTRAGESVKLLDLVDEGIGRAAEVVRAKAPELPAEEAAAIAEAVAVGAIKYADLSNDRIKDYVFDWNKMLAFDGNTAPYLMTPTRASARCSGAPASTRLRCARRPSSSAPPASASSASSSCASRGSSGGRPTGCSRTGSPGTSTTWPRPSPASTRAARC
jgi:arginyl-tRNA synthetase